jgi:hypothetical protein
MRVRKTPYVVSWEEDRQTELKELLSQGVVPAEADLDRLMEDESSNEEEILDQFYPR